MTESVALVSIHEAILSTSAVNFVILGGAILLRPEHHEKVAGKALMVKAKALDGDLEVELFREKSIGRRFYAKYVFALLQEKSHQPTGQKILRLKYTANNFTK